MESKETSGQGSQPQETLIDNEEEKQPSDSVEKQIEELLKANGYDSIDAVKIEFEDAKDRVERYASRPKLLKQAQDELKQLENILQQHAQLAQSNFQKLLDDIGLKNIDEAIAEKQKLVERLNRLPMTSIKARKSCQEEIDCIDEILKIAPIPSPSPVPPPEPKEAPEVPPLDVPTLFEREMEDASNHAKFIKSAPDCFEKSVKILTHILYQKLDKKMVGHDDSLNVNTSEYDKLIHDHLENIKTTYVGEVMKNSDIMAKVNSLQHPNGGNPEQLESILKCLKQIQPLTCKFNFQEFFSYIQEADRVSSKLANQESKIIVLLLGTTGAGKSTSIHYICGSEMYETSNNGLKHIAFKNVLNNDLLNVKVSPFSRSETRYIRPINIDMKQLGAKMRETITLVDTPGLFDLKNAEVDVSNQIGIVKALQQVESIRPFIVFSYKRLGARGEGFKEILIFYSQMIINSAFIEYFNFFFSHVDKDVKIDNLTARIQNILDELNPREKQNARLVKFLQVIIDRAADGKLFIIDPLNKKDVLKILTDIKNTEEIPSPASVFQKVICDESNSKIIEQFELHKKAIISAFKKANGDRVDFLLSELKAFCQIMETNQDYKQKMTEILKNLNERLKKNYDEVVSIFEKQLLPGNKIGEQEVAIYQSNIQFSFGVEKVRQKYLQEISGNSTVTYSYQDLEKEVERLIRNAYKQLNEPKPAKFDSQNLQDYLQKLEFLANSQIQNFIQIRDEFFKEINKQLKKYPTDASELLRKILTLEQDEVNNSISQMSQNDDEELKNFEEEQNPVKPLDQFASLMKELEKAEQITKNSALKQDIRKSIDSIVEILKKKFEENLTQHYFKDFQNLNLQNANNLCGLTIDELESQFRFQIDQKTFEYIQKYYQFLEAFIRSMITNGLSQTQIEFAEGKLAKFNEQIIFWYSVQEEKLKYRISHDKKYTAIKIIYEEIMLVKNLPALRGQGLRQNRIKMNLTKLVKDKTEEAQKYVILIKNVVDNQQKVEEGKSNDNQQINYYTLVQLKEAIRTIKELKWTIENGNEDIYDDLKKELAINLEELVKLIQENVKNTKDQTTTKVAQTEQAFKQISEIQQIATNLDIILPDINIEEFIPEIESNLNGAERFFRNKTMFKTNEENKNEDASSDLLLKKSECEKFFQYYTFLNNLRSTKFMIKQIDDISGKNGTQKTNFQERVKILQEKLDDFINNHMKNQVNKEFKKQIRQMEQYLKNMQDLKRTEEGLYINQKDEILASQYLFDHIIDPINVVLSIFKMIKELKEKYNPLWNKLRQNEDYQENFKSDIWKFFREVDEGITRARNDQVRITNSLKIIKQLIPLEIYIIDENEKDKIGLFQMRYQECFNQLMNYNDKVLEQVQKHVEDSKYGEIKLILVTLSQLDGIDQQTNLKNAKNILHQKCVELRDFISKEIKYLVRDKKLDDEKTDMINKKSQELSSILKDIGPKFLDEKLFKECDLKVKDVQEKMSADLDKIIDYIRNKIQSQSFSQAQQSIQNYQKTVERAEYISQTSKKPEQSQDYYFDLVDVLKNELSTAIERIVKDFELLKNTSLNSKDDSVLELIIQKSPKEITENLKNCENFKKDSEYIIQLIEIIFNEKISLLDERVGKKGENGQEILQQINKYLKHCGQLPQDQNKNFTDKIINIKQAYLKGQQDESDRIRECIENDKEPPSIKKVFNILDEAVFSLDPKCKDAFNKFYNQASEKAYIELTKDCFEGSEAYLYDLWLFQTHPQIRTQFQKDNNDQIILQRKIIGDVYTIIIKGIEDFLLNRDSKNQQLSLKIFGEPKQLNFDIEKIKWYYQLFKAEHYKDFAKDLLPNAGETLTQIIDLGTEQITKYLETFQSFITKKNPADLLQENSIGNFQIIQLMQSLKGIQELLTNIDLKCILEACNDSEQSNKQVLKFNQFFDLSKIANYENFCLQLAEKYHAFIKRFNQPKFFNIGDSIDADARKTYYEELGIYLVFVQQSHIVSKDLQIHKIDSNQIQQEWESKIKQYHDEIGKKAKILIDDLMKSVELQKIKSFLENLKLTEEIFKFIEPPSSFDKQKTEAIKIMQKIVDEIKDEIRNLSIVIKEELKEAEYNKQVSDLAKLISESIISLKDISLNVTQLKKNADDDMKFILAYLKKNSKDQNIIREIASLLRQSPIGAQIIEEEDIFIQEARSFWAKKTQNQGVEYVLENLEKNPGEKLSPKEIDELKEQYNKFDSKYKHLVENNIAPYSEIPQKQTLIKIQLLELTQNQKKESSKISITTKSKLFEVLAYLFAYWTIQDFYDNKFNIDGQKNNLDKILYIKRPQPAQVISIFRIFGIGYEQDNIVKQDQSKLTQMKNGQLKKFVSENAIFDNLVQIKTGEGKSVTLAMVISIFALWDFDVSCACYSEYLSTRDFQSFQHLFNFLKIKVFYGTFNQICERYINKDGDIRNLTLNRILKDSNIEITKLDQAEKRIILIDEVDVFFSKEFFNKMYVPVAQIKNEHVTKLLDYMWNNRNNTAFSFRNFKQSEEYKNCAELFKPEYVKVLDEACKDILGASRDFKHNYICERGKIGYQEMEQISYTKSEGYKTIFAHYHHNKTPAQDGSLISDDTLKECKVLQINCGQFSYAEIPMYSMLILGVTGTLESLTVTEKEIIQNIFQIRNFTYIPSVYGESKLKWKDLDPLERTSIKSNAEYFNHLTDEIRGNIERDGDFRAVIVYFKTLEDLKVYKNTKQYEELKCDNKQELTDFDNLQVKEQSGKGDKIALATHKKTVTLTTRSFGRGTDFICRDESVEKVGGVHVILTFVPEMNSEFIQIQGRTARQGNKGSFQMILLDTELQKVGVDVNSKEYIEEYKDKLKYIFQQRDKKIMNEQKSDAKEVTKIKDLHNKSLKNLEILIKNEAAKSEELCNYLVKINLGPNIEENFAPVKTMILMDATGSMSDFLTQAKNSVNEMYERSGIILKQNKYEANLNMIQFACYRNYSSGEKLILQSSPWESRPDKLKAFMDSIQVSGGMGNEAIEIGFQHAVKQANEGQKPNGIPLRQIYLIGDIGPNTKQEVDSRRNSYPFWKGTEFEQPAYWDTELDQLIKMKIPVQVNTFYVHKNAEESFKKIANMTGGTCTQLDLSQSNSQEILLKVFIPQILEMIGKANGDLKIGQKMKEEYLNCYKS